MAKDSAKAMKGMAKGDKYPYPSQFGSHASMVHKEKTEQLADKSRVVCVDEFGEYETDRSRLDKGADPNRYRESRLEPLFRNTRPGKE